MPDREKVIDRLQKVSRYFKSMLKVGYDGDSDIYREHKESVKMAIDLLKEQEELLKHEYWRGYNNGRADERGLQEGTIMQTFSPD